MSAPVPVHCRSVELASRHPVRCSCLGCAITLHRDLYRDDAWIERLVQRQPPTVYDRRARRRIIERGSRVGMNLSSDLIRYLSHPEEYGARFPWARALWLLRAWCRNEHPAHRSDAEPRWRGALCPALVDLVIIRRRSVYAAGRFLNYTSPRPVLREALRFLEDQYDATRVEEKAAAKDAAGRFSVLDPVPATAGHTPLPGLHAEECPTCLRATRPFPEGAGRE